MKPGRLTLPACGLLVATLLLPALGCESAARPGFLLVVVDSLRRDALGAYGGVDANTPSLDALARRGVLFTRAYTAAPWTQPAVASMLTGLDPTRHTLVQIRQAVPDELATIAERLAEQGYATSAVVSHRLVGSRFGFEQGFEVFSEDHARGVSYRSTGGVTRQAVLELRRLAADPRPFFLFVHYFDPHYDYLDHPDFDGALPPAGRIAGGEAINVLRGLDPPLRADELAFLRSRYAEEVRSTDRGIGRLLDELDRLDAARDTTVIFTADHGEEFMEYGWLGHTRSLRDPVLAVPLIVRLPGTEDPREVTAAVSTASIAATVLQLAGDPEVAAGLAPSLVPLLEGRRVAPSQVFAEVDFVPIRSFNEDKRSRKRALIEGDFKLVVDELSGDVALYDLREPTERRNLAPDRPEQVERMRRALSLRVERSLAERATPAQRVLSEAETRQLEQLGYGR